MARLAPQWKRTPYDEFMRRLHNAMKEDASFSAVVRGSIFNLRRGPAGWSTPTPFRMPWWPVNLRRSKTVLVEPAAMVAPESALLAVLEKNVGARLV